MNYQNLSSGDEIRAFANRIKQNGRAVIALDFEGEFNLHVYGEKLCLIQIHDGEKPLIIDPLKADLGAVKSLLEDDKILKIMWDASSDISLIVNGYDMTIKSVLDLRPAADILDLPKRDYASVLGELLGIATKSNKSKFQRYNWLRRPIDEDAINYALEDVLHLHQLRDEILKRVYEVGRMEEFIHQNIIVQNRDYLRKPGQRHKKMKGYRYLNKQEQQRLKELFELRDGHARELNWPPHRVIPNQELMELARGGMRPEEIRFDRSLKGGKRNEIIESLKKTT